MYDPYFKTYLGLLNQQHKNSSTYMAGSNIDHINLYYQPTPHLSTAIIFCTFRIIFLVIGEVVQFKLFKLVRKENGLVKEVTQLYTLTLMTSCPVWVILISVSDFVHPANEVIGQWFCTFGWLYTFFSWNIISFHSFIVATMRYFFIVKEEKVKRYGKPKAKRSF